MELRLKSKLKLTLYKVDTFLQIPSDAQPQCPHATSRRLNNH